MRSIIVGAIISSIYTKTDVCLIHEPKNSCIVYSIIITVFPTVWDESFTNNNSSPTSW